MTVMLCRVTRFLALLLKDALGPALTLALLTGLSSNALAQTTLTVNPTSVAPGDSGADDGNRPCSRNEQQEYIEKRLLAVMDAWQPPDYGETYSCTVAIALNFRGEVLDVVVEDCTRNDLTIRKSVEDAAYDASPLPVPANRACMDRTARITLTHRPTRQ